MFLSRKCEINGSPGGRDPMTTTPTNTRLVPVIRIQSAYTNLYTRVRFSRYQYGKLDYGDRKGAKRMCAGEGSSCVRSLISKADDLWQASPLRGTSWPLALSVGSLSRSYDKGWASTHPHAKGPFLGSWHDGAESSVWFECECLKHNGNVIPFLVGEQT